ncbi:MAG: hypothetical protein ABH951_01675, partial [Patescibacteria group bacterium]
KKVQKSPAIFNPEKLDWINKEYIKKLVETNPEELKNNIFKYLPDNLKIEKLIPIISERISKFSDIKNMLEAGEFDFFLKQPDINKEKLIYKNINSEKISENLKLAISALEKINENNFEQNNIKEALLEVANNLESRGELLHPVRYVLSGLDKSPDPFIIAEILGKNETISRLQKGI